MTDETPKENTKNLAQELMAESLVRAADPALQLELNPFEVERGANFDEARKVYDDVITKIVKPKPEPELRRNVWRVKSVIKNPIFINSAIVVAASCGAIAAYQGAIPAINAGLSGGFIAQFFWAGSMATGTAIKIRPQIISSAIGALVSVAIGYYFTPSDGMSELNKAANEIAQRCPREGDFGEHVFPNGAKGSWEIGPVFYGRSDLYDGKGIQMLHDGKAMAQFRIDIDGEVAHNYWTGTTSMAATIAQPTYRCFIPTPPQPK